MLPSKTERRILWQRKLLQKKLLQKHLKHCKTDVQATELRVLRVVLCLNGKRRSEPTSLKLECALTKLLLCRGFFVPSLVLKTAAKLITFSIITKFSLLTLRSFVYNPLVFPQSLVNHKNLGYCRI